MQYDDYVSLGKVPVNSVVCTFRIDPPTTNAAAAVAAESSTGTWSDVPDTNYVKKISAFIFERRGQMFKIAYPITLFEKNNIPQLMSSVAGNVFDMKNVKNLRLEDIEFPRSYYTAFKGPAYGIKGIRKIMKIRKRPLIGTIIKPKLGLNTEQHAERAYQAWIGGCDIVKDDENLSNQKFNKFQKRGFNTLMMCQRAENETGFKKAYMPNITAETNEMIKRAKFVEDHGGKYIMIDVVTTGWAGLQTVRDHVKIPIHAHRAGHGAFTRMENHGIAMRVIAKICRMIGIDQLHTGTVIGKMQGGKGVFDSVHALQDRWRGIKSCFAVCSGGLCPTHAPELIKMFGRNIIIQAGGGIHSHPKGTIHGAEAMMQAVEAGMKKISLTEYAENHTSLRLALEKWGLSKMERE
uniref:RuBisCO long chain n=1 Tax=uncultured Aenigmarchaeota archaeon TaxID=1462426 RepID=A0A447IUG7_9ARCH|nr:RuBisCO long chain [uncultured Aenigmarchaeota archaeon]